jgi:folate-dependent phosphoribosylglycinamide formyltransferase PurN
LRIAILTRYPRVDTGAWKRRLAESLLASGVELSVFYTRSALTDHLRAGMREFGLQVFPRYRLARGVPAEPGANRVGETFADWAEQRGVPVTTYRRIGDPRLATDLRQHAFDLVILAGADIVPRELLDIPRIGTLNPHYGSLPGYRGMNVTEWAIYHDDPVSVSVHLVDAGIDTGDILLREPIFVEHGDTLQSIRAKQQLLAAEMICRAVSLLEAGTARPLPQRDFSGRQYYRMHPVLREQVEAKLRSGGYRWLDRNPTQAELTSAARTRAGVGTP